MQKFQKFLSDISERDWTDLMISNSMEEKENIFNNTIQGFLNKHAPLQRIIFKNLPAPWLTDGIKRKMHERDRLRRAWRRNRNEASYENYKTSRNTVQNMVREAKRSYYLNVFGKTDNPATTWSRLRHLGLIKAKEVSRGLACSVDELNEYFAGGAM